MCVRALEPRRSDEGLRLQRDQVELSRSVLSAPVARDHCIAGLLQESMRQILAASAPCPGGTQLQIRVYAPGTTTEQNGNFNIAIF